MYPCPIRMRAQSFHNFLRKAILKLQDQLSQHDQCKKLNQRYLRCARRFKSTNQCIATKETSLCGAGLWFWTANGRDTLIGGFESTRIPQIPLEHPEVSCLVTGFLGWVSLYVVGITNMKRSLITFHLLLLDFFLISILIIVNIIKFLTFVMCI